MLPESSLTKEVSPWLSLSVKWPRLAAISAVAPTGSCPLPVLRLAPSAVNPSCPTELASPAVPTMAARFWLLRLSKAKCGNAEEGVCVFLFFLVPEESLREKTSPPLLLRQRCAIIKSEYVHGEPNFLPAPASFQRQGAANAVNLKLNIGSIVSEERKWFYGKAPGRHCGQTECRQVHAV